MPDTPPAGPRGSDRRAFSRERPITGAPRVRSAGPRQLTRSGLSGPGGTVAAVTGQPLGRSEDSRALRMAV